MRLIDVEWETTNETAPRLPVFDANQSTPFVNRAGSLKLGRKRI